MAKQIVTRVCKIDGCEKRHDCHGFCKSHADRLRRYGDPLIQKADIPVCTKPDCNNVRYMRSELCYKHTSIKNGRKACAIEACVIYASSFGLCNKHAHRFKRHGDPLGGGTSHGEPMKWLHGIVNYNGTDCIPWPFARGSKGDSVVVVNGTLSSAVRTLCSLVNGDPSDPSMQTAHSCGHGHLGCMNPVHLRWATAKENAADKIKHGTRLRGEDSPTSKLTENQARFIHKQKGFISAPRLARKYSLSPSAIYAIWAGRNWAWIE